ncbi:MAG: hypothetical protein WD830_03705, partial [Chloroflexota bacterium]
IQDATAGIYVRLADPSVAGIVPGRTLQVDGTIADPFGNLELRPLSNGVQLLEMVAQPSPRPLDVGDIGEGTEGWLARTTATIKRMETSSTGSLTLVVEDDSGEGRVFAHASLGLSRDDFSAGDRVAVIGLVGDRLGLYRLWPRNRFDISVVPDGPSPTPTSGRTPTATPTRTPSPSATPSQRPTQTPTARPTDGAPPVVSIADALRRQGQTISIDGAVTTRPGLLDADGVRITVQDSTGAVLVRLPDDFAAQVGQRLRLTGEVGTYYGAPQLTAESATRLGQTSINPLSVRAAPFAPGLEWRLVTITGQVESVHRDGDAWRAEIVLSGGGVPVVGLERSGIDSTALIEGRVATVTGIVKRAYPTASDQRFALVPRTAADIRLGAATPDGPGATGRPDTTGGQTATGDPPGSSINPNQTADPAHPSAGLAAVALSDLAGHEGAEVAVGGTLTNVDGARLTIHDGSASAVVRLVGAAAAVAELVGLGDLVNVRGIVERNAAGGVEVAVSDPNAVDWLHPVSAAITTRVAPSLTLSAGPIEPVTSGPASTSQTSILVTGALFSLSILLLVTAVLATEQNRIRVHSWLVRASTGLKRRLADLRPS